MPLELDFNRISAMTIVYPDAFSSLMDLQMRILFDDIQESILGNLQMMVESILPGTFDWFNSEVVSPLQNLASYILGVNGFSQDKLYYYRFRINPVKIGTDRRKILDSKLTGGSWDIDTRGEEMITKRFNLTTGSLMPEIAKSENIVNGVLNRIQGLTGDIISLERLKDAIISSPKLSIAYIKLKAFEKFWEVNNDDVFVIFEDNAYVGKFTNVSIQEDGETPYIYNYNFDLIVYPQKNFNIYTGNVSEALFQSFKNTRNIVPTDLLDETTDIKPDGIITSQQQAALDNALRLGINKPKDTPSINGLLDMTGGNLVDPFRLSTLLKDRGNTDIDILEDTITFNLFGLTTPTIDVSPSNTSSQGSINLNNFIEQENLNGLPIPHL